MQELLETQLLPVQTYPARLRGRGQITIPQQIRDRLAIDEGDFLAWVEIGDMIFLTTKPLQVPKLADKLADMLDTSGLTLADLLLGLTEQRQAMWQERSH